MDGLHAAIPGCAAEPPVLPDGEVWVAMPYKPAFPGIIPADETPPGVIEDQTRFPVLHTPDNDVEVGLRCRPAVACWIGIHLEAFYSTALYRFTWPEDTAGEPAFPPLDDVGATIADTLRAQIPAAELFYVSADLTDLASHAATTLADYRLHPEDLPAPVGLMVYEHPPVEGTVSARHDAVSLVSWGPGRGGLWVQSWGTVPDPEPPAVDVGRRLARLPRDYALDQMRKAAALNLSPPAPDNKPASHDDAVDLGAKHILATFLRNAERAPIPPSFSPPHGYEWCGLTPMTFTDMKGWPSALTEGTSSADIDAQIALQRTILTTWLLMGQTLVRSERTSAPRARPPHRTLRPGIEHRRPSRRPPARPHRAHRPQRRHLRQKHTRIPPQLDRSRPLA